ncbi:MAG: hypothetical protein ACKN9V_07640 [Pseudomonadota bacterium]
MFWLFSFSNFGSADSFTVSEKTLKNKVTSDVFFSVLDLDTGSLTGAGVQAGLNFGISERLGLGFLVGHVFTSSGSTLFNQISVEAKWALTGNLISPSQTISSADLPLVKVDSGSSGGLMVQSYLHEYLVHTSSSVLGYAGVGAGLSYELPNFGNWNFRLGVRTDYSLRGSSSFFAYQAFGGLAYRF